MEKKEAMKILKDFHDKSALFSVRTALDTVFPEFVESEDERIRKGIIQYLEQSQFGEEHYQIDDDIVRNYIAWLEKQGEHAKFRDSIQVGDKVTRNQDGMLVNLSQLNRVVKKDEKQNEQNPDNIDNKFISMRETKPKDISEFLDRLTTVEQELLWEHIAKIRKLDKEEQKSTGKVKPRFKFGNWVVIDSEVLYIKEVTEDGYLTDEGGLIPFRCDKEVHLWTIQDIKEGDVLHSPTHHLIWIYKDNEHCYAAINLDYVSIVSFDNEIVVPSDVRPANKVQRFILFQKIEESNYIWDAEKKELKKIEQNPAWSEDDENRLNHTIQYLEDKDRWKDTERAFPIEEDVRWLKSLKDRVQPKQEWSKEDERIKNNLLSELTNLSVRKLIEKETENKYVNWLKSLRSQNTWKPSEEMLEALYRAIPENVMEISEDEMLLDKLYQGLKYGRVLSNK